MKSLLLILCSVALLISCNKPEVYNTELNSFLTEEDSKLLNYLVSDFENSVLKKEYKNLPLNEAYIQFLKDVKAKKSITNSSSKEARELFNKSNLRLEMYTIVDSVWVVEDSLQDVKESKIYFNPNYPEIVKLKTFYPALKIKTKTKLPDNTFDIHYEINDNWNLNDSVVRFQVVKDSKGLIRQNMLGSYNSFLRKKQNYDTFIKTFFEKKTIVGMMSIDFLASGFLFHKIDTNNPLMRQIIVLEFVY